MQTFYQVEYLVEHESLQVQYSLPDDGYNVYETFRRQDELN